jgi:hypothetical protein
VLRTSRISGDRARDIAEAIRKAVIGARTVDEFETRVRAVPHSDAQVLVERVEPFQADGRVETGQAEFDRTFVAAAFAMRSPADISPVIQTKFGWHVIFLVARLPPTAPPSKETHDDLAAAVVDLRARTALQTVLAARIERSPIELVAGAESLLARVREP